MSPAAKWAVPPGYRGLEDVLQEYGRDHTRDNLVSGQWAAFKFDTGSGDLDPIPAMTWCAGEGRKWLEDGKTEVDHPIFRFVSRASVPVTVIPGLAIIVRLAGQQPSKKRKKRQATQRDRVCQAIAKGFPDGTDGISTKEVHRKVLELLEPDSKKRAALPDLTTTVKRALGRRT